MLALWEYFWDWAGTNPIPVPTPITPGRGSGKSSTHETYRVLPDEYWEARAKQTAPQKVTPEVIEERTIRLHEEIRKIIEEQQQVTALRQNHSAILATLKNSASVADVKTLSEQSKHLKEQLTELEATNKARIIRAQILRASLEN